MKMKLIAAAALVAAFAMPAFAANEFYLVQDTATKKCSVVESATHGRHNKGHRRRSCDDGGSRGCDEGRPELRCRVADSVSLRWLVASSVSAYLRIVRRRDVLLPSLSSDQST